MRVDLAQGANAHVKRILPPSLGGMPGEAEISYYVKATVQRPAFYKENFRAVSGHQPRVEASRCIRMPEEGRLNLSLTRTLVQEIPVPSY